MIGAARHAWRRVIGTSDIHQKLQAIAKANSWGSRALIGKYTEAEAFEEQAIATLVVGHKIGKVVNALCRK